MPEVFADRRRSCLGNHLLTNGVYKKAGEGRRAGRELWRSTMAKEVEKEEQEGEQEAAAKGGKLKLIILAVAGLLVLGGGGGAAAYFMGLFGGTAEPEMADATEAGDESATTPDGEPKAEAKGGKETAEGEGDGGSDPAVTAVFVDLPDVLVNLQSSGKRMRFLKLRVALEVADEATAESIRALTPRVMDSFQLYLRALTVEEVEGAVGLQRLKEELLARVNRAIRPLDVEDVLFKEMLVQ